MPDLKDYGGVKLFNYIPLERKFEIICEKISSIPQINYNQPTGKNIALPIINKNIDKIIGILDQPFFQIIYHEKNELKSINFQCITSVSNYLENIEKNDGGYVLYNSFDNMIRGVYFNNEQLSKYFDDHVNKLIIEHRENIIDKIDII
jgi:hypothetical protein